MKEFIANLLAAATIAVTALTGVFTPSTPAPVEILNKYEVAQMQTVLIRVDGGGMGSGVVVKRTNPSGETRFFVWTAAHVVDGAKEIEIVRIGREDNARVDCELTWSAITIALSKAEDLALLWVQTPSEFILPVEFNFTLPRIGDPIFHVGNYYGDMYDRSVAVGIVAMIGVHPQLADWPWPLLDQTDLLIVPGSSGGGVFDANGKVIGLIVGLHTPGISLYVPVREILRWSAISGTTWALQLDWCPTDESLTEASLVPK